MRFLIASATTLALLLVSSVAGAYEMRMSLQAGSNDPGSIAVGESFVYEIFLDTTNTVGDSRITLFSVSFTHDPTIARYDRANSATEAYYPLYAPAAGKTQPLTFLVPVPFDGYYPAVPGLGPISTAPKLWTGDQPALGAQVNIDFIEVNLNSTVTNDTNLLIARIAFNSIAPGTFAPEFSFNFGGNVFSIEGTDIADPGYAGPESLAATLQDGATVTVPEPGLVGLALGALGTLGFLAAQRRRS